MVKYFKGIISGDDIYIKSEDKENAFKELILKEISSTYSFTMINNDDRGKYLMIFFDEEEDKFVIGNGLTSHISLDSIKQDIERNNLECYYLGLSETDNIEINGIINDMEYTLINIIIKSFKDNLNSFYEDVKNSLLNEITEKEFKSIMVKNNFK